MNAINYLLCGTIFVTMSSTSKFFQYCVVVKYDHLTAIKLIFPGVFGMAGV